MAMCRVLEALEVELKALSPALLTDPTTTTSCPVLQRWLLILYGTAAASTEGWKAADPRVYKAPGWKAASEGKTVFALAGKVPLKLLSHQCTGFAAHSYC